ncbi:MAG: hypothetical protein R8G01_04705 [Ilumatobacteraceae bacterium]|nr:hypothetical protein [Ilumatobacteraceae bacterium]
MRSLTALLTTAALTLAMTACGGDDDTTTNTDDDAGASGTPEAAADEPADDQPAGSGGSDATLTLANGETFEFGILCSLEPQMAAGSEILFTAVSYDTPGLDITQFGDEGNVTGIATISVYDESYESLWEAGTFYEAVGGTIELSLDGSTIRGSGSFFPGGDTTATPVDGEIVAEC